MRVSRWAPPPRPMPCTRAWRALPAPSFSIVGALPQATWEGLTQQWEGLTACPRWVWWRGMHEVVRE